MEDQLRQEALDVLLAVNQVPLWERFLRKSYGYTKCRHIAQDFM